MNNVEVITPVILAGGLGSRLWPLSRKSFPKQFVSLITQKSLFQQTALRLVPNKKISFAKQIIVTNDSYRFTVQEQLTEIGIEAQDIIIEPMMKNTAPAVLVGTLKAAKVNPEALVVVAPSDHFISDDNAFHDAMILGISEAKKGNIITFGITPTGPETNYGYLELGVQSFDKPQKLRAFIEKPDLEKAQDMIASGKFLWNSGIFLFRAKDLLFFFETLASTDFANVTRSLAKAKRDLNFLRLEADNWKKCEDISLDYSIMEKIEPIVTVPLSAGWSDLGNWKAVAKEMKVYDNEVNLSENSYAIDCKNSVLRSESKNQVIVGLGLDNIMAISMPDAVLVMNKEYSGDVKKAVEVLKKEKHHQADIFPKDHRPWGWFEIISSGKGFQVKRISVRPGASLSLQSHKYRSEHWVVVIGAAEVTIDGTSKLVSEGESVHIPLGSIHRLKNPGQDDMQLIEVQTGSYLGEDDIVRFDDEYSRS